MIIVFILKMSKLRDKGAKQIVQGHTARKQKKWGLNPIQPALKPAHQSLGYTVSYSVALTPH